MLSRLCSSDAVTFKDKTRSESFTLQDIEDYYGNNGEFYFRFKIQIVNNNAVPISDSAEIRIDSRCKFHRWPVDTIDQYHKIFSTRWPLY